MRDTFDRVMQHLFAHEGGYVDHPRDPGGATNMGITHNTLSAWRGRRVSKADVRNLTKREAMDIYRAQYWNTIRGDDLPAGVDYAVFDAAVNSGPARAAKWLQEIVGVRQDGIVGAITLDAARKMGAAVLVNKFCDRRYAFVRSLSTWNTFGKGWTRRIAEVRAVALDLAKGRVGTSTITETPTPKARPEDVSITETLKKPEAWGPLGGLISGLGAVFSGNPVLQYGLVALMVAAAIIAVVYFTRRMRSEG